MICSDIILPPTPTTTAASLRVYGDFSGFTL